MPISPRLLRPIASQQAAPSGTPASLLMNFDGSFTDESGNGLTVTNNGVIPSSSQSKFGGASAWFPPDMNQSSSYYLTASGSPLNLGLQFTIEMWFYPTTYENGGGNGGFQCLFAGDADFTYGVMMDGGGYIYMWAGSSGWSLANNVGQNGPIPLNEWSHIAFVRSGRLFSLFVNGQQAAHEAGNLGTIPACAFRLGIWGNNQSPLNNAYVDGLRITQAALYCDEFTPPTAAPTPTTSPSGCPFLGYPPAGTLLSSGVCQDCSIGDTLADGNGGSYFSVTENDGCLPAYGTYIEGECIDGDAGSWYADGTCGGTYFEVDSPGGCE
jgi:Concanavalin A-like lectin/glucanases superfamily